MKIATTGKSNAAGTVQAEQPRLAAHARGDPLELSRLVGLSDPTAIRDCAERNPLDQATVPP